MGKVKQWLSESNAAAAATEEMWRRQEAEKLSLPFNPRVDVSADARYIVNQLILWFLIVAPIVFVLLGGFIWLAAHN